MGAKHFFWATFFGPIFCLCEPFLVQNSLEGHRARSAPLCAPPGGGGLGRGRPRLVLLEVPGTLRTSSENSGGLQRPKKSKIFQNLDPRPSDRLWRGRSAGKRACRVDWLTSWPAAQQDKSEKKDKKEKKAKKEASPSFSAASSSLRG